LYPGHPIQAFRARELCERFAPLDRGSKHPE
jgi:hypothetical protein